MKNKELIKVYCKFDEMVSIEQLQPNPENPNIHPDEQIELLAQIIKENGWRERIVVSNLSGMIVKGHGRYQAAILAGFDNVPVEYQDYDSRTDEIRDLIADNKIAELSELDPEETKKLIEGLESQSSKAEFDFNLSFDLAQFGYTDEEIQECFYDKGTQDKGKYTRNIKAPIYKPKGNKPKINDLFNDIKTNELIKEIKEADTTEDIKEFLICAARRHTVFHYNRIADFYCHSEKTVQRLIEKSGLIIIDFKRAIELGYVKLSKEVADQYGLEHPDD